MSNKIDSSHIQDVDNFPWNQNVSMENNTITYENITFEHEVVVSANNHVIYNKKTFKYNNNIPNQNKNKAIQQKSIIFKNCTFLDLIIRNTSKEIEKIDITSGKIEKLTIVDCDMYGKFYINKQYGKNKEKINITNLIIKDTIFHENFKLHNANVTELTIEDTDFEKHADFFKSTFVKGTLKDDDTEQTHKDEIGFKAINFKGLALFGDTEFQKKLIFKYVTFESFSHFRKAKLYEGLDLDYSNIQNEMNFFDVQKLDSSKAKNNTSQETFRIIKHNFNKIGNVIEANKYHSLELKKRRNQLKIFSTDFFNYLVFFFHWISSNHSKSWILPVFWIFTIGFGTYLALDNYVCYRYGCSDSLVDIFNYISIINDDNCIKKNPIIFILNKVLLGYFYYQFITAIRKDTRK